MPKFIARQRRPMWVCVIQEIEADSEEDAEETFYNSYNPTHLIIENQVQRVEHGPLTIFDGADFPDSREVADAD